MVIVADLNGDGNLDVPGWDSVTGLGVPNSLDFAQAVVAAAP
jgi:hypothetical protein